MNLFAIPPLATSVLIALFGVFILIKNFSGAPNKAFFCVCLSTAIWLSMASLAYMSSDLSAMAENALRFSYIGISFLPVTLLHFVSIFLDVKIIRRFSPVIYALGMVSAIFVLSSNYLIDGMYRYFWGYYPKAGQYHPFFLVGFLAMTTVSVGCLIYSYFKEHISSVRKDQIKYVLLGFVVFNFAALDFFPNYGIAIYAFGYLPTTVFLWVIAYSIIRYRFLDISTVITRTSIFLIVYSIVLGIPFVLAFGWREQLKNLMGETWWMAPLVSSTVLATAGPSIYLYIQRKAEDRLLQEQRRYQATLRRASLGMGRIKDLQRLLNLTVHVVTRTVHIEYCAIYLFHPESSQFTLKAVKGEGGGAQRNVIDSGTALVRHLQRRREPLVYDEIKQRAQDFNDQVLREVQVIAEDLNAALVLPSFIEDNLIAVIVLGKKRSNKLYSHDDLIVFSILANQVGLAIENAQFYEDMKKTHEQLIKAEKMATIGTMADGLSHQINNRLHAMGFIAGDALDTIKLKKKEELPPDTAGLLDEIEHSLDRIQDNVKRGGEIVEGLLKYSRKAEEGFSAVELDKLLDASLEMAQFKIKLNQFDIKRNFNHTTPKIRGNFTQLQEVFFNIIDNSYDAIVQRRDDLKEPEYRGTLEITANDCGKNLEIIMRDNGIGVQENDLRKLFTPFFTTKLSSRKGTGLGLYVMRKIIEENHNGKVEFTSDYRKGSQTRLVLPIAT